MCVCVLSDPFSPFKPLSLSVSVVLDDALQFFDVVEGLRDDAHGRDLLLLLLLFLLLLALKVDLSIFDFPSTLHTHPHTHTRERERERERETNKKEIQSSFRVCVCV